LNIPKLIDKLKSKYEDLYEGEEPEDDIEFDFNYYIFTLERILTPMDIRSKKLTSLKYYNEMALKLQKSQKPESNG